MKGMDCWSGEFANAAGRKKIVDDIAALTLDLVPAKEKYETLNADNEREAAEERELLLADSRDLSLKLVNRIKDSEKAEAKA